MSTSTLESMTFREALYFLIKREYENRDLTPREIRIYLKLIHELDQFVDVV